MALPHYKLHTPEATTAFPVLLAPTETPPRAATLKQIFCSRKFLIAIEILAVAAGATLLWLLLDPTIIAPKPLQLWIPGITLGVCLLLFLVIALVKNGADIEVTEEPELPLAMAPPLLVSKPKKLASTAQFGPEMTLEIWSSEPFEEIMDEALMAEVFNNDFIAPDQLVFSIQIAE